MRHEDNRLHIDKRIIDFDYLIKKVVLFEDMYLVLIDSASYKKNWGTFPNLFGIDKNGNQLWVAELPDYGSYYEVKISEEKILAIAPSWDSIIDPKTGKITEKIFTK